MTDALPHHIRMRSLVPISACLLTACAGADHHAHGPAGIPYLCGDGQPARIVYEGGGYYPRGTAELSWRGRTIDLAATPPTHGLRYQEPRDERPILVWRARGEEAWLHELAADFSEREIAHCTRVREGGVDAHAEPAHH